MVLIDKNNLLKRMSIGAPMNWEDVDKRPPNIGVELDWWNAPYKKE